MSIGSKVKALRAQVGMTQEELAKKINVTSGTIGMIETDNRKPSIDVLRKIATLFNVSTDFLLDIKRNEDDSLTTNPYIREIARAGDNMSIEDAVELRKLAERLYPDAFKKNSK